MQSAFAQRGIAFIVGSLFACVMSVWCCAALAQDAGVAQSPVDARVDQTPTDAGSDALVEPSPSDATVPETSLDAGASQSLPTAAPRAAPGFDAGVPNGAAQAAVKPEDPAQERRKGTAAVVRTVLGLIALLVLAYLAAHERVRRFEEWLGISQVVTMGFPFVALGVIARAPGVDILTSDVLHKITPLLQFGLGWIGLLTGFQFRARTLDELPEGTATVVTLLTLVPFSLTALACGLMMFTIGIDIVPTTLIRDAVLIGSASALAAPTVARIIASRGHPDNAIKLARNVSLVDDIAGVAGLALLGAYIRPEGAGIAWQLSGTGWLFVTVGLAGAVGAVVYAVLRRPSTTAESMALLLGSVAFMSGMAGYLALSPLVVCFLTGVILRNLPGSYKPLLIAVFNRLERSIYLLFLIVAGALWDVGDWRGWLLMPVFVATRFAGRLLATSLAKRLPLDRTGVWAFLQAKETGLVIAPIGSLAIALVVSAQTLYQSYTARLIVTAVIGGAIVTEIVVQLVARRHASSAEAPAIGSADAPTTGDDR